MVAVEAAARDERAPNAVAGDPDTVGRPRPIGHVGHAGHADLVVHSDHGARGRLGRQLLPVAVLAVLVRVLVAVRTVPHRYDMEIYTQWASALVAGSPRDFYQRVAVGDHLPGDVVIHLLLGRLSSIVWPTTWAWHYPTVVRAAAIVFDLALVAALVHLARVAGASRRTTVLLGYGAALMPGFVIVSSWWGQWDALSALLVVLAFVQAVRRRFVAVGALLAWAALVKPQTGLAAAAAVLAVALPLAPLVARPLAHARPAGKGRGRRVWVAAVFLTRERVGVWGHVAARLVVGAALVSVPLCALFGVNPFSRGDDGLLHRVDVAHGTFTNVTLGATNLWRAVLPNTWVPDDTPLLGWSIASWGALLALVLAGVCVMVAVSAAAAPSPAPPAAAHGGAWTRLQTAVWLAASFLVIFYMVITRCHERYLFPALVLCVAATALHRSRLMPAATVLFALSFAGTVLLTMWTRQPDATRSTEYLVCSWVNILATLIWLVAGLASASSRRLQPLPAPADPTAAERA